MKLRPFHWPDSRVIGDATAVLGRAHLVALYAHNTMYRRYARVVGGLRIDRARALREVDDDYSTMTEIADTLVARPTSPFAARTATRPNSLATVGRPASARRTSPTKNCPASTRRRSADRFRSAWERSGTR